jgi:hypothetical protein
MKRLSLIVALWGILTNADAQSTLIWSEDFTAGLTTYYHYPNWPTIQADFDTIKVIGRKNTSSGQRLQVVKYDLNGDTLSTMIYGNDSLYDNMLIDYKFDSTNHVYLLQRELLGYYKSKIVLQKYALNGTLIWSEQIQNLADTSYRPLSLALVNDTCLLMTAYKEYNYPESESDVEYTTSLSYLFAYHSNGNLLWQRAFDPDTEIQTFVYDVFVYKDTAFLFANNASEINRLIKVDINNNLLLNISTGVINGINKDIQLTPDNQLLMTAYINYRVSKVELNGSLIWTQIYGTNLPSNHTGDQMRSTIQDAAGNIYITGKHYGLNYGTPNYTNADILTLKYDSNGNLIWENRYQYGINNADIGDVIQLKNGYIYVGGESQKSGISTNYDYVVLKIDAETGVSNGVYRYDGLANGDDVVTSLYVFDDAHVALTGLSYTNDQFDWTTQYLSDLILSDQSISSENIIEIYPNPVISGEMLTVEGADFKEYAIISAIGQIVQNGILSLSESQVITLENVPAGIYLLYLKSDKEVLTRKIIVE